MFTLSAISFMSVAAREEETLGDDAFLNFMADSFQVFRFPLLTLIIDYLHFEDEGFFVLALMLNVLFYASLIEIMISLISAQKRF
ncbi:hypothetical protein [Dyadobacter sp. CY323]|uniref:hypothetical protein n=1 Tax=Dyadobacter sp. CY323 TaxID=2907302 RepID=UPI001F477507|nr:hypothetical protein [Dyadobacter sp. CY323]MCE6991011.1 hypothetical protein [Dyadobacter sp. CY323]